MEACLPDTSTRSPEAPDDFRVRTAAVRRDRMRQRLLDAVLDLYQPSIGAPPLIDDVVRAAAVSRGTFYKYFESVDAAVATLGGLLVDQLIEDFGATFADEEDQAVRAIGGLAIVIARAWHDPRWAGFTCRVDYVDFFERRRVSDRLVRDCLIAARSAGQMRFVSCDVAVDLIVGASIEARRRMMGPLDAPGAYVEEVIACTFRGLGMTDAAIATATRAAWQRLRTAAPAFDWWRSSRDWPARAEPRA